LDSVTSAYIFCAGGGDNIDQILKGNWGDFYSLEGEGSAASRLIIVIFTHLPSLYGRVSVNILVKDG